MEILFLKNFTNFTASLNSVSQNAPRPIVVSRPSLPPALRVFLQHFDVIVGATRAIRLVSRTEPNDYRPPGYYGKKTKSIVVVRNETTGS